MEVMEAVQMLDLKQTNKPMLFINGCCIRQNLNEKSLNLMIVKFYRYLYTNNLQGF